MKTEINRQYRTIRMGLPPDTPITMLHIGGQATIVATGAGAEPDKVLLLAVGSQRTASEFFLHAPPTAGEIENAIRQVEDEVERAREMIAAYPTLHTTDDSIRDIAHIASGHTASASQLPIQAVEQVFSLLVSYSLGRPAASAGIPGSPEFAATLLILREFMHHLKFSAISVIVRSGSA